VTTHMEWVCPADRLFYCARSGFSFLSLKYESRNLVAYPLREKKFFLKVVVRDFKTSADSGRGGNFSGIVLFRDKKSFCKVDVAGQRDRTRHMPVPADGGVPFGFSIP
jgi:hypothetical protein